MSSQEPQTDSVEREPAGAPQDADTTPETAAPEAPATEQAAADDDAAPAVEQSSADDAPVAEVPEPAEDAAPADVAAEVEVPEAPAEEAETPEPADDAAVTPAAEAQPSNEAATVDVAEEAAPAASAQPVTAAAPAAEETPTAAEPAVPADDAPAEDAPTASEPDGFAEPAATAEATETPESAEGTETSEAAAPAAAASDPSASPRPTPKAMPRALPRPPSAVLRPAAQAVSTEASPTTPVAPPAPPALTAAEAEEAARWGRVDEDGTVHVREGETERVVGQYPGAEPADALAFYVRRYADLHAKVGLLETRLSAADVTPKEVDATLESLTQELAEPAAVGDLAALRERLEALRGVAAERRAAVEAERAAAKKAALESRTAIVEAAEKIAATDPERVQWKPAGEQLRELLDQWKDAQRHGPRIDRGSEDALWKRFSHARSTFDRERRRFFSDLEKQNASAKAEKQRLVTEAERLASSTEWGATSAAYRDLMTQWKAAGRASRKDDDALWAKFRAAQDRFFEARDASQKQTDEEFSANLEVKLALLAEAEKLVPVRDLGAAKAALRDLQDRWEKAGKVPRGDVQRVEGRLRAVEQAVRDAEQAQWQRSNPETRARAEGAAAQLHAAIAGLEADLDKAKAAGDARRIEKAQQALDARRAWLEQVERAAADSR